MLKHLYVLRVCVVVMRLHTITLFATMWRSSQNSSLHEEHTSNDGIRESTGETSNQTFREQTPDPMYTECSVHTILS